MTDKEIKDKLRRLMELREDRDTKKTALKRAEDEYRELETEAWDMLEESILIPPIKVDLGEPYGVVRFENRETNYGRIIDKAAFIEWLEKEGRLEEYTENKPVMQRLNEEVRDAIEQGGSMPPGVDYYPKRFVSQTKEKGS